MQFSVPNRTRPESGAFDSRPASVKACIEALPMANIGDTTRLIYAALNDLNHQDIPAQQRLKSMQLLHKPIHYISDRMKKHFVGQALPLSAKNLKIAHLSRDLSQAMATGYKVIVAEQLETGARRDKKLLRGAIHHALWYLGQVLLKTYQAYEPYPTGIWLELHTLYRIAESQKLHRATISDGAGVDNPPASIDEGYKQILLLALACPYRLRHGEAGAVYQALLNCSGLAELQPLDSESDALFLVDPDQDQPPGYRAMHRQSAAGSARLLDTRRLAARLCKALTDKEQPCATKHGQEVLREQTLRRLMLAWGITPKRRFSRVKNHSQVIVSMGLSSIHYFVSGEVAFNAASVAHECYRELGAVPPLHYREPAQFDARSTAQTQDQMPDIWELSYRLEGAAAPSGVQRAVARAAAGMHIDTSHYTQSWKMVNVSADGYCMLWDNPETTRAQVGELLGIREESDHDTFHWRLGVIRWMKYDEKRGLELGVQMLSPGAVAIAARPDADGEESFTRGLLLPEIASIQQRATLLLPSPPFKVGHTAVANCHGKDVRVELTELVENTGSFAQFQYISLGEIEQRNDMGAPAKKDPQDYDDLWELL